MSQKNISSIVYRLYEPSSDHSQSFSSAVIEIESTLRNTGQIVSYDATKRKLWHFRFVSKEDNNDHGLVSPLEAGGHGLLLAEEGILEPPVLQKGRSQAHQQIHTPTSSSPSGSTQDNIQRHALVSPLYGPAMGSQELDSKGAHPVGSDPKPGHTPQKTVYENFITSVLLTISAAFCRRTGALPLNYRTVLLPSDSSSGFDVYNESQGNWPVLGTFRTYLTTTGVLILSLAASHCKGLLSLDDTANTNLLPTVHRILAAPFGVITNGHLSTSGDFGTASLAHTPNTQVLSLRGGTSPDVQNSLWKQSCLRLLEHRGIAASALVDYTWINLAVSKAKLLEPRSDSSRAVPSTSTITVTWPGQLCFRRKAVDVSSTSRVVDAILSGHEESHDPLGGVKGWLNSAAERDEKISKRIAERAAAAPKEQSGADSRSLKTNGQSPLTLRRPSTATAGAMYPTPPDGIQHPNGVTPSIDGTLSSPGNPLSVPAAGELEVAVPASTSASDNFDDASDFQETKRQRSDNNILGDADNMFGDMGGDMFDDNDITEADFNFFDEQPGDMDLDMSMADLATPEIMAHRTPTAIEALQPIRAIDVVSAAPPELDNIVFAKPELKHARSCQNDEPSQRGRDARVGTTKRESSPFDPNTVFKRVRASLQVAGSGSHMFIPGKVKTFEKVHFDPSLPKISKKYEQGGQFDFSTASEIERPKLDLGILPETDYLKRHGKSSRRSKEKPGAMGTLMKTLTGLEQTIPLSSPVKMEESLSDVEDSSMESDQDDSSYTTEEPTSPTKASAKMALVEDDAVSQVTSLRDVEVTEEPDHHLVAELPRLAKPDYPEVPLSSFFSDPEPLALETSLNDDELVQIAQILAEQAATGSLDIGAGQDDLNSIILPYQKRPILSSGVRNAFASLEGIISPFFGETTSVKLKGLLDVQDVPLLGQPTRLQPRPIPGRDPNGETLRPSNLYQIPSPHLEVRRGEMKLSVLPSAVMFWESLGLAPSSGSKNVSAVCVFPRWTGLADNVATFLGRVKSVYEFLKLGTLENLALSADFEDGVLPYEVDRISTSPDASMTGHGSALIESLEVLRAAMLNSTLCDTNIVVYFVYSPKNPGSIVEACTAFQRFFDLYQRTLASKRETPQNELVLQLVSVEALSSPTTIIVTPAPGLVKLCMETYDRCTLFDGPMPAPAIRLEQPLPRIIDFKLTTAPSASLIRENSCIHVSYAQSIDDRWVSAAWTDDRGNQQATAAYCLGRKGRPQSRALNEIAHEIWESTLALISVWKVHWRIIITKCGAMDQQEIEFWVDLARTEIKATVTMILMTVDTDPSLQLLPPVLKLPAASAALYTTPVSTPQPNILSPEQSGTPATPVRESRSATATVTGGAVNVATTAATPSGDGATEADSEAVLADVSDQTWGAVAGHRLSNTMSILEVQPVLISGYLIKRTGTKVEDVPVLMEVNLVHTDAMPRAYEPLLREMLSYFRGLGTLARARGVVERETDVRPWHVAAAEKAVRALYLLM